MRAKPRGSLRKTPLRALAGAVAAGAILGGCHHGSSHLAGHWRGTRVEGVAPNADDVASAFAGKMTIDVSGDSITVTTSSGKETSSYKVVSEDKTTTVITTDLDASSDPQTFTFVDDKTIRWQVVPGKAIVLAKE